jgi:hypothetical protein
MLIDGKKPRINKIVCAITVSSSRFKRNPFWLAGTLAVPRLQQTIAPWPWLE